MDKNDQLNQICRKARKNEIIAIICTVISAILMFIFQGLSMYNLSVIFLFITLPCMIWLLVDVIHTFSINHQLKTVIQSQENKK